MFESTDLEHEPPRPVITMENVYGPETEWEKWLYKLVWTDPARAMALRAEYADALPTFGGEPDDRDVLPPGAAPVEPPQHWLKTPIHFTPLADPRYTRMYHVSKRYYTFTDQAAIKALYGRLYAGEKPKHILDIGTGVGPGALALAQLFPEAEVIGVDLGAHFLRFARGMAERQGITNVRFYKQHAAQTVFEDESFDIVVLSYVLHEMPSWESAKIVNEMRRLLKPKGRITFADVIYDETEEGRNARVQRAKGPEPFMGEYMKFNLEQQIRAGGFVNVTRIQEPDWDCMVISAIKL
jgi:ubiquinone/menaquinone biosynthesis C-methylase UbiE